MLFKSFIVRSGFIFSYSEVQRREVSMEKNKYKLISHTFVLPIIVNSSW